MKSKRPKPPPKALRDIWAGVPKMLDCQGKCDNSCAQIHCSDLETKVMEDRAGKKLDVNPDGSCTFLNGTRCSLYSIRPVICRLWGVVESMPCPHGCKPERVLTDEEGFGLVAATMELDGDIQGADELRHGLMVMDAEVRTAFRKYVASTNDLGGPLLNPEYVAKAREEFVEVVQRKGPVYPRDR